jgi:membrane protein required for colicin V production
MIVGAWRGFFKEAVSVVSLVVAIWLAFQLAPLGAGLVETVAGDWIGSEGLQAWIGRGLIFVAVLLIGGLVGWLISMLVEATGLSGTDRFLGLGFGFGRGALLAGVLALAGGYLGFSQDGWWQESRLMPYAVRIGDGIRVLAPRALEVIDGPDAVPTEEPDAVDTRT